MKCFAVFRVLIGVDLYGIGLVIFFLILSRFSVQVSFGDLVLI